MSTPSAETKPSVQLRIQAEGRLKEGSAPPTKGWPTGVSTLSLLYKLASSPASAEDALKLLHELQVHQVELDLQQEQVEAAQREVAEDLARYKGLFHAAPAGYVHLDATGHVLEGNAAAADFLGIGLAELDGRRFESLLAPPSRPALLELLQDLRAGASRIYRDVIPGGAGDDRLRIVASRAPESASFLLVLVPLHDRKPT
jgi:PAS domain-containing protein